MRSLLFLLLSVSLCSSLAASECSLSLGAESVKLPYQYAVHLSDPEDPEEPVLSRLICTAGPLTEEQLWDWSQFRETFHAEGNQGFYIQFQDSLVVVVGLVGHEENFSSAGFPALQFDGEISEKKLHGTLRTDPAPTAFDEDTEWTITATVDLEPLANWE